MKIEQRCEEQGWEKAKQKIVGLMHAMLPPTTSIMHKATMEPPWTVLATAKVRCGWW